MTYKPNDIFSRLTILAAAPSRPGNKGARKYWLCECSCGVVKEVREDALKKGTKSCGCLTKEVAAYRARLQKHEGGHVTHNLTNSSAYSVWSHMKERCLKVKNKSFQSYGAKGVTVDERWLRFENFYADMGDKPEGLSLDRIDTTKGYNKENCRWATKEEQMDNRTNSLRYEYRGELLTRRELAKIAGLTPSTIQQRLHKLHWTVEDAVGLPKNSRSNNKLTADPAVKLYRTEIPNDTSNGIKNCS